MFLRAGPRENNSEIVVLVRMDAIVYMSVVFALEEYQLSFNNTMSNSIRTNLL